MNGKTRNDIIGKHFGILTVIERQGSDKSKKNSLWLCKCNCGKTTLTTLSHLKSGHTTSCGCLGRKHFLENSKKSRFQTTHGLTHSRLYRIWLGMKRRCDYVKGEKYPLYGGRGITVCNEWKTDFMSFYHWSMENGYNDKLT